MVSEDCARFDISTHRVVLSFHVFGSGKVSLTNVEYEELKDLEDLHMEVEELFYFLTKRGINLAISDVSCKGKRLGV